MFVFLFDLTIDSLYYAMYISLFLSFSVKIALVWAIEYKLTSTTTKISESKILSTQLINLNINKLSLNDILDWLIIITRRKDQPDDDSKAHSFYK